METDTSWCPEWYATIQVAKYLGVAPWELDEQPSFWFNKGVKAMTAEYKASEEKAKHHT